jgi:sugar/nucleoside kinase (ribokinase family)
MAHSKKDVSPDVVVAGYLGVDIAPGFPAGRPAVPAAEFFRPGKLIDAEGLSISLGGVVANTGLALQRFGQRVELMGGVGNDAMGEIVMTALGKAGLAGGIRRHRRAATAYGIVLAPPGTDRIFLEDAGCNGVFTAEDINYKAVAQSRLFHFGYPPLMRKMWENNGAGLRKMFRRVRQFGVATSLDMALPDPASAAGKADWQKILAAILPFVDIFAPSVEEVLFMMDRPQYARLLAKAADRDLAEVIPQETIEHLANQLIAMGVKVLMIKAGSRGAYFQTDNIATLNAATALNLPSGNWSHRRLWTPSYPAELRRVKNACGAGDCAVAGFLASMLHGSEIEQAARCAMLAGRDNLYGADACSGLSSWKKMAALTERQ